MVTQSAGDSDARLAFSPAEAARLIGLGRTTLYAELSAGRLKSIKVGARRLITAQALKEWLAARDAEAGTDGR